MEDLGRLEAQGKWNEALELVQSQPTYDAPYFFNLGVIWGHLGNPGRARSYFQKADSLKSHDPEILKNLKFIESEYSRFLSKSTATIQKDVRGSSLEEFAGRIPHDEMLGVVGIALVAVALLWLRAYLKTRQILKALMNPSGWFGTLGLSLVFGIYGIYLAGLRNPPAYLLNRTVIKSGPGVQFPDLGEIESGVRVRLIGAAVRVNDDEYWQKIRYQNDETGFVPLLGVLPL